MGQGSLPSIKHLSDFTSDAVKDVLARTQYVRVLLNGGRDIRTVVEPPFQISHGGVTSHFFPHPLLFRLRAPRVEFLEPETEALTEMRALLLSECMSQEICFKSCG